ncbi:MAG: cytochrome c subunit of cbb3 type cytochrome oxidase [Gemmatimonadetes bacterium]|nr:cytochrome c subunit of cbb3 type cytochrome oxidase [Gemmatimonadota bacterium]
MLTRAAVLLLAAQLAHAQQVDGKRVFTTTCAVCHQASGDGIEEKYPPLAGSEWVTGDDAKLIRIILHGLMGPVEVAGVSISSAMPGWGAMLKDADVAAVATYVRSAWGNAAAPVTTASIAAIRAATASRTTPWTVAELAKIIRVRKE